MPRESEAVPAQAHADAMRRCYGYRVVGTQTTTGIGSHALVEQLLSRSPLAPG